MKRVSALLLSTAVAASIFAGCSNQPATSEPAASSVVSTNPTVAASESVPAATTEPEGPKSFEELYGDQLLNYLDHQYFFDGEAIPTTESNFYFINAFLDLSGYANMGYYPATTLGYIDLAAEFTGDEYATFGDYYLEYAENSLESTCILNARAKEAGTKLSDETYQDIDEMLDNIRTTSAANSGMTLDEYLQFYYGPGNDEATFRKVLERYYIADVYSKEYCENYQFTDEEKYVPYIRYALFYAPDGAEQDVKDKALESANAMKDACKTIDDLTGLATAAQENGVVYDQGDIAVPKGQMVPGFEAWAYGEGRTEGELDVIYTEEYGYFVVGYLGLKEQSKDALDKIALNELSTSVYDEVQAKTHDFHTDMVYQPAPAAPTPTEIPPVTGETTSAGGQSFNPDASTPADPSQVPATGAMTTTDVLVVVFITLAAVAVLAVIVILVVYAMKNGKGGNNGGNNSNSGKSSNGSSSKNGKSSSKKSYDDDDDDEDEEGWKPAKKNNSKSSKKDEEEDEDPENESDEDSDEDSDEE